MTDHLHQFDDPNSCPNCGSPFIEPVKYTWWGGMLGPKLLHHTRCNECKFRFNSKTRKSNTTSIAIYFTISFVIAVAIVILLRNLR